MNAFKRNIIEKADEIITDSRRVGYATKRIGSKIRSYPTGNLDKNGKPEYIHIKGGVTRVKL
jgi:hypothetical protein